MLGVHGGMRDLSCLGALSCTGVLVGGSLFSCSIMRGAPSPFVTVRASAVFVLCIAY